MKPLNKLFIMFAVTVFGSVLLSIYFINSKMENRTSDSETSHYSSNKNSTPLYPETRKQASSINSSDNFQKTNDRSRYNKPEKLAWRFGGNIQPVMQLSPVISIYEAVELLDYSLYPQPGEKISLPLPGAEIVTVTIKSSESHANGDYTWRGHLDNFGNDYPVVTTYGKNSVFSTITTPKGSYTLEVINGQGWIYKNPSVFELSKPGYEDGLTIP